MALDQVIASALPDIIAQFEAALREIDSPLLHDERARVQVLEHARQILENAIERTGGRPISDFSRRLPRDIGVTRAVSGVHPSESLRAGDLLFGALIRHLSGPLRELVTVTEIGIAASAMHEVLSNNLRIAADSYIGVLLNRVHQAQIEERKRISRDLHDRIGNSIAVAQRDLELFEVYQSNDPSRAADRVEAARRALVDSMESVRQTISELRVAPPMDSLEKSLRLFLDESAGPDLAYYVQVNGDQAWASAEAVEETFLILREALRNTLSHANARHVVVRVDISPGELRASAADDGTGFEPGTGTGTGLLSMRERAALLGGTLLLRTTPGNGTVLELRIPLGGGEP